MLIADVAKDQTFMIYLYEVGGMTWDSVNFRANQIGYFHKYYQNTYYYNSPFSDTGRAFQIDQLNSNTGMSLHPGIYYQYNLKPFRAN